jgi:hypothetical protein
MHKLTLIRLPIAAGEQLRIPALLLQHQHEFSLHGLLRDSMIINPFPHPPYNLDVVACDATLLLLEVNIFELANLVRTAKNVSTHLLPACLWQQPCSKALEVYGAHFAQLIASRGYGSKSHHGSAYQSQGEHEQP